MRPLQASHFVDLDSWHLYNVAQNYCYVIMRVCTCIDVLITIKILKYIKCQTASN